MVRRLVFALLLASACTVRNPSYQPQPEDARAPEPTADLRSAARSDQLGRSVPDPDGTALDVAEYHATAPDGATDLSPPDLGPGEKPGCLPDEIHRGNRCYELVSPLLPVVQKVAAQLCADRGSALVSVGGFAENAFLFGLLPPGVQGVWIGLERTGPGNEDFAWASGEPFSFESWAPGEPNNLAGLESCVVLWGPGLANASLHGHWNDAPCSYARDHLLCERVIAP